jgi:hypothetical protein
MGKQRNTRDYISTLVDIHNFSPTELLESTGRNSEAGNSFRVARHFHILPAALI